MNQLNQALLKNQLNPLGAGILFAETAGRFGGPNKTGSVSCILALLIAFLANCFMFVPQGLAQTIPPPAPGISITGGFGASSQTVSISGTEGTIFYTTNGTTPTTGSTSYSAPFIVTTPNTTIKAVAYLSSTYSTVTTAYVQIPVLWLRADQGVVTNNGTPGPQVGSWQDFSSSSYNATGAAGSYPTLTNNATNCLPAVTLNGSSQYLTMTSPAFDTFASGASIFIVAAPSNSGTGFLFDVGNGSASNNLTVSTAGTTLTVTADNGSSSSSLSSSSGALAAGQFQLIEAFQNGSGTGYLYINGQQVETGSLNNLVSTNRAYNHIGTNYIASGDFFQGSVAEVLVYPNFLPASSRESIEAWIMQRFQIAPSLCSILQVPSTPVFSVPTSTLTQPTQVIISSQLGSTTYYTVTSGTSGGTTPTTSSPIYTGSPITINYGQVLEAMSVKNGVKSCVATATYTMDSTLWTELNPTDTTAPSISTLQLPTATAP